MASGLPNPKAARVRPSHYYEGMIKKKGPGETVYKKFWSGLQGSALYFYNHHKDTQYVDVINLDQFVSMLDDNSSCKIATEAKLTLKLRDRTIHLKFDSMEHREMWKGFIVTVTELKVPEGLSLLPGPRHMMSEVLQKEQRRRAELELEYDVAKDEELPPCFYKVSRMEAEDMLNTHPERGNFILRPKQDGNGISVSTCQECNGVKLMRHYAVSQNRGVYIIEVDQMVRCKTLFEVMNYFVEKTSRALVPYCMETDYEDTLKFIPINEDNGAGIVKNTAGGSLSGPRGLSQQDSRGATRPQFNSWDPPPIPSVPPPDEEEEDGEDKKGDREEEDAQFYINGDVVKNLSGDHGTLPRTQTKLPPTPAAQPVQTEESFSARRYSIDTQEGRNVSRIPPPLPKQALVPKGRGCEIRRSSNGKESDLPPQPLPRQHYLPNVEKKPTARRSSEGQAGDVPRNSATRQQCFPTSSANGIEEELKRALQLRYNQC
ncbi:signal-transducing adaptor protein 2 isoform X2 [Pleurodeles waltl]|uniref:signal-transducing adaptor protein 2 isoform X2 n=1 Tax=Pleurodeles waltl TaxID=8319 RepID=UPI0037095C71